jgi:hypothetical protein
VRWSGGGGSGGERTCGRAARALRSDALLAFLAALSFMRYSLSSTSRSSISGESLVILRSTIVTCFFFSTRGALTAAAAPTAPPLPPLLRAITTRLLPLSTEPYHSKKERDRKGGGGTRLTVFTHMY